ncbi:MAG: Crp/Fnr family transcriptional regulator [Clostridia bacterium]|nr:Crp/Fnr family transcriptional regulator [Clostridia bacterium]
MPERCPLFAGLSPQEKEAALRFFGAREKNYPRGAILKAGEEPMRAFGLVLSGRVCVSMQDFDGREMILAMVTAGETFGEALCCLRQNAPLTVTAPEGARVLWLRCEGLLSDADGALERTLRARFTAMLARRTLRMNDRIQILSRGSIREKLNAFFTERARDAGGLSFTVPFDRAGMAAYLGVDRSALSRELSRMRGEGLIEYHKNKFTLQKQQTRP